MEDLPPAVGHDSADAQEQVDNLASVRQAIQEIGGPMIVDCHTHMYADQFDPDLVRLLQTCRHQCGIDRILVVSEDDTTSDKMQEIGKTLPDTLRPMWQECLGVHPCMVRSRWQVHSFCDRIRKRWADGSIVAIGEVGLDFTPWYLDQILQEANRGRTSGEILVDKGEPELGCTQDVKELQRYALREFSKLSLELDLPLNVHSRSAGRPTVQLLQEVGAKRVLMHCFDGSAKVARQACAAGFHFSIPANVVRSPDMQRLVRDVIPMDLLLLETDSPALHPRKPSNKSEASLRNDPTNVLHSVATIAKLKGITARQVIEVTYKNARKLFPRAFL